MAVTVVVLTTMLLALFLSLQLVSTSTSTDADRNASSSRTATSDLRLSVDDRSIDRSIDLGAQIHRILLNHTYPPMATHHAKHKSSHDSSSDDGHHSMQEYCNNYTLEMQKLDMPDWYVRNIWKTRRDISCKMAKASENGDDGKIVAIDADGNATDWQVNCNLYPEYWQSTVWHTFYQAFFNIDVSATIRFPKFYRSALISCFLQILYSPVVLGSAIFNAIVIRRMLKTSQNASVLILFPLLVADLMIYFFMAGHFTTLGYILVYPLCYTSPYVGLSFDNFSALLYSVFIQWAFWFGCLCHTLLALDKMLLAYFPVWHATNFSKRAVSILLRLCAAFCILVATVHAIVMPAAFDAINGRILAEGGATFGLIRKLSGAILSAVVLAAIALHLLSIIMVAARVSGSNHPMSLLQDSAKVGGQELWPMVICFLLNFAGACLVMGQYFLYITNMLQIDPLGYADEERVLYYCSAIFLPLLTTVSFYVQYFAVCNEEKTGPALMLTKLSAKVQEKAQAVRANNERY